MVGTVAINSLPKMLKPALVPLNSTFVAVIKLSPVIVILASTGPFVGEKLAMTGAVAAAELNVNVSTPKQTIRMALNPRLMLFNFMFIGLFLKIRQNVTLSENFRPPKL